MAVRVVFADDQVPSENVRQNDLARDEIVRELRPTRPNVEADYEQDEVWFRGLINYLEVHEGFTIIRAKTIFEAESKLQKREDYDVAVIDLSWFGDPNCPVDKRDAGLRLLRLAAKANRGSDSHKPVIAFSQNFRTDFELVTRVRELGALPVQKDYSESGHRILGAAIRLLSDPLQGPFVEQRKSETTVKQLFELVGNLSIPQAWGLLGAVAVIISGVFVLGYKLGPLVLK